MILETMMKVIGEIAKKRKLIIAILGIILVVFGIDYVVGKKQEAIIREKEAKKERLEKLAFFMIFPDIHDAWDVKNQPEKYEAVIKVDNVADEPVYVTHPRVTTYVQTGTFWTEVPIEDKSDEKKEQLYKLETGQHLYSYIVTIDRNIKYTYYLMFGYMHVRFHISLFVLPESAFKEEEVIERYTDVYIYLKPFFLTDKQILKEVTFTDNEVPVMIPMPPH
jgi:hypothetical protein